LCARLETDTEKSLSLLSVKKKKKTQCGHWGVRKKSFRWSGNFSQLGEGKKGGPLLGEKKKRVSRRTLAIRKKESPHHSVKQQAIEKKKSVATCCHRQEEKRKKGKRKKGREGCSKVGPGIELRSLFPPRSGQILFSEKKVRRGGEKVFTSPQHQKKLPTPIWKKKNGVSL